MRSAAAWLNRAGDDLAHELIDALPVQRFGLHNGSWHEWLVGLDGRQQPCWNWGLLAPDAGAIGAAGLPAGGGGRPEGWSSEWCPAMGPWLAQARACLSQGWLLAIDYAMPAARYYAPSRDGGTLLACREQQTSTDLLADPGRMDSRPMSAQPCWSNWLPRPVGAGKGLPCRGGAVAVGVGPGDHGPFQNLGHCPWRIDSAAASNCCAWWIPTSWAVFGGCCWKAMHGLCRPGLIAHLPGGPAELFNHDCTRRLLRSAVTEPCHFQTTNPLDCWV